jgi:signal transduction histidine kinase
MSTTAVTPSDLRTVDLFDGIDDEQLAEWVAVAEPREAATGDLVLEAGQERPGVVLLLEGVMDAELVSPGGAEPVDRQRAPTWIGATAAVTGGPMPVRIRAARACRYALIPSEDFLRLALAQPAVHQKVMQAVRPVITRMSGLAQNRERLTALGTMAAGLAHELNNPAAAAQRAASQLCEAIEVVATALGTFVEAGIERPEAALLVALQREAAARAGERGPLDALDAADAEDELLARMEALNVPDAWRFAEPLAAAGVDGDWLGRVAAAAGPATGAALAWVASTLTARSLAGELQESARRMSDLVGAVKSYAYVDRGQVVEVDIHEGLETTLKVLGHKLKRTEIQIVRDYDRELPRLMLRAPELNQVWTNLLDNAIDALGERGTITVATRRDGSCVEVDVSDDGPGVPPAARERVFDAFFTTKDVGQGTGLGLSTARQIVVDRHAGSLTFDSEPGRTTFKVRLPIAPD